MARGGGNWKGEQRAFAARDLSGVDDVYLRADGIYVNIRLEEHKLCLLVMIGVRAGGRKELIALAALPKSAQPGAKKALAEIWGAGDKDHARAAIKASAFATVRHRTKVTTGPRSRAAGLAMAFRLIQAAQDRWRAVSAPHLVALVRAGAHFERGVLAGRHDQAAA